MRGYTYINSDIFQTVNREPLIAEGSLQKGALIFAPTVPKPWVPDKDNTLEDTIRERNFLRDIYNTLARKLDSPWLACPGLGAIHC